MPNSIPLNEIIKYKQKPPGEKHAQYFEAIFQIRPINEDVIRFLINAVDNDNKVRIAKIMHLKTGIDVYLSSRKFATAIGKKMKARFKGGKLLVTKTLYSRNRQSSKNIYRVTVLFRLN